MSRHRRGSPGRAAITAFGLAALLAVAACASSSSVTYYQPLTTDGRHGYSDTVLAADRYEVSYLTPAKSIQSVAAEDQEREGTERLALAYDMALWRASELALAAGYPAFEVVLRENDVRVDKNWYNHTRRYSDPWFPSHRRWGRIALPPPYPPDPNFDRYSRIAAQVKLTIEFRTASAPDTLDAASTLTRIKTKYAPATASMVLPMARTLGEDRGAPPSREDWS